MVASCIGAIIETQGLTKRFGARTAVDGLDLAVERGTITGFLGPNGAGKSTTIRMLLGLVRPSAGSAQVCGVDVGDRASVTKKIGAIVEVPSFYAGISAFDNLRVFAASAGLHATRAQLEKLLATVGLLERARDRVSNYSLGMKQRLGIAAALITDPELLFLDEPTNGLDPQGTADVRELLRTLGSQGRTIFMSSHVLHEVQNVCTDVVMVVAGKRRLQQKVQQLLQAAPEIVLRVDDSARAMVAVSAIVSAPTSATGELRVRVKRDEVPAVVKALVDAGVLVFEVRPVATSLEDIFLSTTANASEA